MPDRYSKVVLTIIAAALVWLCLWGPGPMRFGTPAHAAESSITRIDIAAIGGTPVGQIYSVASHGLPVRVDK